jgi:hypothetical protein
MVLVHKRHAHATSSKSATVSGSADSAMSVKHPVKLLLWLLHTCKKAVIRTRSFGAVDVGLSKTT